MELLAGNFTYRDLRRDVSEAPEFRQNVACMCIYLEGRVSDFFFLSKVNCASQLGVILSQQTNLVTLLAVMISMGMLRVPRR